MIKAKSTLKKIGRIVLLSVIGLVIGISLYSWNARTFVGNEMPMPFGLGTSVVLSGSMEPTLSVNDLVFVKAQDTYETGDIVVYQDEGLLVIHRIIAIDENEIITQGDANNTADQPVDISLVKGKAIASLPFVGAVAQFLKTPVGFILVIVAAIALFELPYLKERKKANEEQEKIKEEIRRLKEE
ncbi:MAG: signal peptidase I [Ruminococcus sp.]|nr:signal peptidase I [Ruminococcus sp.]